MDPIRIEMDKRYFLITFRTTTYHDSEIINGSEWPTVSAAYEYTIEELDDHFGGKMRGMFISDPKPYDYRTVVDEAFDDVKTLVYNNKLPEWLQRGAP